MTRRLLVPILTALLMLMTVSAAPAAEGGHDELVILNWADYVDPDLIAAFERQHKVNVRVVNYEDDDNRDQLLLATNGSGYDLVVVNETRISVYRAHGWIAPLTAAEVPNLRHVDAKWLDKAPAAKGHAAPYFWGTVGIAYRSDLVKKPPQGWTDLLQPTDDLKGKVAMLSSSREILGMALKATGHSVNSADHHDIDEAMRLLLAQKPYVRAYQQSLLNERSELVTGDVQMRMTFNGDALTLKRFNPNIEYVVPAEGTGLWVDYITVMATAANAKLAYAFVDFLNQPANAAQNAQYASFATTNAAAEKLLPAAFRANPAVYPDAKTLANSEMFAAMPPRVLSYRNTKFSQLLQN
ncbi:MAG: spermidine/putrescine ABC transporter substrate-binding protein [Gammaproteobacteria bacterium]|jgi:spermidine/putrescine transport system substrate-binding protein|nr:spermidine/putrescine ABC transporter substrate-binding protein [Gammaproteobacteria bacterium]